MSYGEVHASVGSTVCQHRGWGRSPWHRPQAVGMKAGSTPFRACPLHPCTAGVLDCKAAVPSAKEPGAPAIWSLSTAPALSPTLWAADVPPPPGQQPGPAQALPGQEARAPLPLPFGPTSSGHLILGSGPELPDPVHPSHHAGAPQVTAPTRLAAWVWLSLLAPTGSSQQSAGS